MVFKVGRIDLFCKLQVFNALLQVPHFDQGAPVDELRNGGRGLLVSGSGGIWEGGGVLTCAK